MKNQFLIYFAIILTLFACNKKTDELNEMNSFLKTNFEFNNRVLKSERSDYHTLIQEIPSLKIDELDKLDSQFDLLIFKIDSLILIEETDIDKTISESNYIFRKAKKIVKNMADYSLEEFKKPKTDSNDLILNHLKNRLVIAMTNAFQYANGFTLSEPTYVRGVDSIITSKTENGIKLTLTSKYGQSVIDNRDILIKSIKFNGQEKKIYYKIKHNYSFADIEFDSLQNGIYKINGILKYYARSGELESWFEKEFKLE